MRFHGLLDDDMSVVIDRKPAPYPDSGGSRGAEAKVCTFERDVDLSDPGGPVVNASDAAQCCNACYTVPTGLGEPCVAAVWAPWGGGQCYLKLSDSHPVKKNGSGVMACITDRKSPKGYMWSFTQIFRVAAPAAPGPLPPPQVCCAAGL